MRPRRCTVGILLLGGVLALLGVFFDDLSLYVASLLPFTFLAVRASLFTRQVQEAIRSLQPDREVLHRILSQGVSTPIALRLAYRIPEGMSLLVQDLPPAGTSVVQGEASALQSGPHEGSLEIRYQLRILSRGDLSFRGISVEVRDAFFQDTFLLGREEFRHPMLYARPATAPSHDLQDRFGVRERERLRAVQGQGIRSFRRFQEGDDVRAIDWKLSVKHGQLMLREYMGRGGEYPTFLLDLPPELGKGDDSSFDRLIADLNARIESLVREAPAIDLLVLSGGALIRFLTLRRDPRPWYRLLATLSPGEGYHPLFRQATSTTLYAMERTAEKEARESPYGKEFFSRIAVIASITEKNARNNPFLHEVATTLSPNREIQIFTLAQGDTSHLRIVIEEAIRRRFLIHLRIPAQTADPARRKHLLTLGATGVEVIR